MDQLVPQSTQVVAPLYFVLGLVAAADRRTVATGEILVGGEVGAEDFDADIAAVDIGVDFGPLQSVGRGAGGGHRALA